MFSGKKQPPSSFFLPRPSKHAAWEWDRPGRVELETAGEEARHEQPLMSAIQKCPKPKVTNTTTVGGAWTRDTE